MFDTILSIFVIVIPTALTVLPFFMPEKGESPVSHKRWKFSFLAAGILLSFLIYLQQSRFERMAQKENNDAIDRTARKVSEDVTRTLKEQYEPTIVDLKRQVADLQNQLTSQGKSVEAIRGSNIVTGKEPIKVEVTNPSPGTTQEPAMLADIRIATQRRVVSTDPNYPYALDVIIQTNQRIQPVAFALECDGEIGRGQAQMGDNVYEKTKQGLAVGNNNVFAFEWESPVFTPDAPIVVRLFSKTAVKVQRLHKIEYRWP